MVRFVFHFVFIFIFVSSHLELKQGFDAYENVSKTLFVSFEIDFEFVHCLGSFVWSPQWTSEIDQSRRISRRNNENRSTNGYYRKWFDLRWTNRSSFGSIRSHRKTTSTRQNRRTTNEDKIVKKFSLTSSCCSSAKWKINK